MKRILALAVLAMAASCLALGQMTEDKSAPKSKVEQELMKLEQDRSQAAVRGDTAFLEQNTADDYTFINGRGMLMTKAQLLAAFKSGEIKLQSNEIDDLHVRVYGDTAVVTGRSTQKGQAQGQDSSGQYRFTRVYIKRNSRWQSVALQQTRIAEK